MKAKYLLLAACCAATLTVTSRAEDLARTVQEEAEKWARALIMHDYNRMIDYTQERVIVRMGGKDAMIEALKRGAEQMKAKGFGVEEMIVGVPEQPKKVGALFVSVIPQVLLLKTPTAKARQESYVLATSQDEGKTWKFVDLTPLGEEQLFSIFPELKDRFKMPPKKQPVVEKAP